MRFGINYESEALGLDEESLSQKNTSVFMSCSFQECEITHTHTHTHLHDESPPH